MSIQYVDANCDAVGTVAQNFAITTGTNDKLQITTDGGAAQTVTLTAGTARTAAQVAADINAVLTGATAYAPTYGAMAGHVRLRTTSANGASSTILIGAPANNANSTLGLSATTYTGASRAHTTWTATLGTKQELINQIETQLLAVGWTTVSGSGTANLLMQSALTPPGQDLQGRLRVKDNGGSCVSVSMESVSGSVAMGNTTALGVFLVPSVGKVWLFTVHKYGGCIRTANCLTVNRSYLYFGLLAIPPFLQSTVYDAMFVQSNCAGDSDTSSLGPSFASASSMITSACNQGMIVNGNVWNISGFGNTFQAGQTFLAGSNQGGGNATAYKWHDGSIFLIDAVMAYGITANADTGVLRGQLWDAAVFASNGFNMGVTTTFDSHNWIVLTHGPSWTNQTGMPGQLLLVTP